MALGGAKVELIACELTWNMASCVYMCYSCGRDLTNKCSDRLNMLSHSCAKILPVWEKLLSERFSELGTSINVQNIISDGSFTGKMCRSCVSALSRFQ